MSDKRFRYKKSLPLREEVPCVSVSLAVVEEALLWEAPFLAASLLEKLHLLPEGWRTHDLMGSGAEGPITMIKLIVRATENTFIGVTGYCSAVLPGGVGTCGACD